VIYSQDTTRTYTLQVNTVRFTTAGETLQELASHANNYSRSEAPPVPFARS
jgi:hypothetical protein